MSKKPANGSSLSTENRKEESPKREKSSVSKPMMTEVHKCLLVEGKLNELLRHILSRVETIDHQKEDLAAAVKNKLVFLYYLYTDFTHYFNSYTNSIPLHGIFNFSLVMLKLSEKLVPLHQKPPEMLRVLVINMGKVLLPVLGTSKAILMVLLIPKDSLPSQI